MSNRSTLAHDLFLLMVNLSQVRNCDKIKELFVDAINELNLGISACYTDETAANTDAQVLRVGRSFGAILLQGFPGDLRSDEQAVIRNAVRMLAIVLENQTNADALAANHQRTRGELAEIQELQIHILDTTPDLIYIYDMAKNRNLYCNGAVRSILGYSADEVVAMGPKVFEVLIHPDDMPIAIEQQERMLACRDDEVLELEYRLLQAHGEYLWVHSRERVFERDAHGKVTKKIGVAVDVSKQKAAEEATRRSELRFRVAAQCMSDLLYEWNTDDGSLKWIGKPGDTPGFPTRDINNFEAFLARVHCEDRDNVRREMLSNARSGRPYSVRARMTCAENTTCTWIIRGEPVSDGVVVGACADHSEWEKLQQQLSHTRRMEAIGQLAGGIAHDFNNLLGSIISPAELLMMKLPEDRPELRRYLDMIVTSAERAADVTKKLLAFSRQQDMRTVPVDLSAVLVETKEILAHTIDPKIRVNVIIPDEQRWVFGDPSDLQNALINLAVNARDAMPGGGDLTVSLETAVLDEQETTQLGAFHVNPGQYHVLNVADSGLGIPGEILDRIFDPFFTTKGVGEGTGLGLAAVYGTAIAHRGAVTVDSVANEGSTFSIYLPVHEPADSAESNHATEPACGSGRILVVDDEEIIRATVQDILESLGYDVVCETNGARAMDLLEAGEHRPDACILDLAMPEMGGERMLECIARTYPDIKVIVATGYLLQTQKEQLIAKGAARVLQKPLRLANLAAAVNAVLGGGPNS